MIKNERRGVSPRLSDRLLDAALALWPVCPCIFYHEKPWEESHA